jgi:DNA-directed RNA polymerase specialized sigma24 family protein
MRITQWDEARVKRLCERDETEWSVFTDEAIRVIRSHLHRTYQSEEDLDDACMEALLRICKALESWDPGGPLSLASLVWRKTEDVRIEYLRRRRPNYAAETVEDLGEESPSEQAQPIERLIQNDRAEAISWAVRQLDPAEYRFLRSVEQGCSLPHAAADAGYPSSVKPANLVRRVKRKLVALLRGNPYFIEHPEDLDGMGVPARSERNSNAERY